MNDKILSIIVTAQDKASAQLQTISSKLDELGGRASTASTSTGRVGGAIETTGESAKNRTKDVENFTKAFVFGNVIFSLFTDAARILRNQFEDVRTESESMQASMAQLTALLSTTHDASGQTTATLSDMADQLSKTTPITKASGLAAEAMLLPFTNISKNVFPGVLQASADLATHLNHGLAPSQDQVTAAAQQLGRAFNDPSTGMTLLKRAGISLTSAQEEVIKKMQAAGDAAGAQKQLLQDLSQTLGGSAAAAANTFSGRMTIMKNYMVDMGANGITYIENKLNDLAKFWTDHQKQIDAVVNRIVIFLTPAFKALGDELEKHVFPMLSKLWHEVIEPLLPVLGTALVLAIWAVTNGLDLLLKIVTPVFNFLLDHKYILEILAGAFLGLAAAMAFNAVFNAITIGFNTLTLITIPSMIARVEAMQAVILAPLVMPAIAVGAALAALGLVIAKVLDTQKVVEDMQNAVNRDVANINSTTDQMYKNATDLSSKTTATLGQVYKLQQSNGYTGPNKVYYNQGTYSVGFAEGGYTGKGYSNDIAGVVHKGEYVLPKDQVDQSTGKPMGWGGSTFNMYGSINLGSADAVDSFFKRLDAQREMAAMGAGV